jgi:hypothetical protein
LICASAWATTVWWDGVVTRQAWKDTAAHLEVNNVPFTVLKDATFFEVTKKSDGVVEKEPIRLDQIYSGQKVMIRIQGHRIYEVQVLK